MKLKYLYTFIFIFFCAFAFGQYNKETLQKQSAQLKQEISELNKALETSRNQSKTSLLYITNLNKKINARAKLINTTRREAQFIDDEIYLRQLEINKLQRDLAELRKNYAQVLVRSYKNKSIQNKILFVLSSEDISQAFRRIKYLQKYSEYQDKKAKEIADKQADIKRTIELKEKAKQEKINNLSQQQIQMEQLDFERKEKQQVVDQYIKEQGDMIANIKQKQAQRQALDRQVQAIIAEEIRLAKAKEAEAKRQAEEAEKLRKKTAEEERAKLAADAKAEAEKNAAQKAEQASIAAKKAEQARIAAAKEASDKEAARKAEETRKAAEKAAAEKTAADKILAKKTNEADKAEAKAEAKLKSMGVSTPSSPASSASDALTRSFEASRKDMPWPVEGQVIVHFGRSPHPIVPEIYTESHGVEIASTAGSLAKAVFNGKVTRIISVPGGGRAVLVNHGDYYTLYSNLETVIVSSGDAVKAGQALGRIYTDDSNTLLGFQIWKGSTPQNPANWFNGM
ncbi:MAG: peptidoglycan DD-metalloendopeptidase family protein [Flavobacteriaceae bacterium]|jgi:septal ring factor EnvC (AmiA/AmiB activator)|nr:peptidoglycan DD-metalloendopeptidase family protein [Flavobacteriaceae bacterium]